MGADDNQEQTWRTLTVALLARASMHSAREERLLPGIRLNTSAGQMTPIRPLQTARFDGKFRELFGGVLGE